jgi:hypothetical protein
MTAGLPRSRTWRGRSHSPAGRTNPPFDAGAFVNDEPRSGEGL